MATYTTLQADIITHAMRDGDTQFESAVPGFIERAEERIKNRLRVADMETIAYVEAEDLTDGAVALPDDFVEVRQVFADTTPRKTLDLASPAYVHEWSDTSAEGIPDFYDITGNTLRTFPLSNVGLRIDYYAAVPALSDSEPTNWLLTRSPSLYLWGAMLEAAIFMREEGASMLDTYAKAFERSLLDMQNADQRRRYHHGGVRVRGHTP
jgi:hypothetical protein